MVKLEKVLLIDDDTTAHYLNERIVRELQIAKKVQVLHNGRQGLDYLSEGEERVCPELIILDHYMPVLDGMEIMEALHKSGRLEKMETVFLLLAAHTSQADIL